MSNGSKNSFFKPTFVQSYKNARAEQSLNQHN